MGKVPLWNLPCDMKRFAIPATGSCWLACLDLSYDSVESLIEHNKIPRNMIQCFLALKLYVKLVAINSKH